MVRSYLTEAETYERKLRVRYSCQDNQLIGDVYPTVKKIEIKYSVEYRSFAGVSRKDGALQYDATKPNIFEVDCPNRDCTIGYFDLKSEVIGMIQSKTTEKTGTYNCVGDEAYDHEGFSCGSILCYTITIIYR